MFIVLLFAFGHAGYIAFSATTYQFRSLTHSFASVLLSAIQGLDVDDLQADNVVTGPLFSFVLELVLVIILVNIFLAIINSAYDEVSAETRDLVPKKKISLMRYASKCCSKFRDTPTTTALEEEDSPPLLKPKPQKKRIFTKSIYQQKLDSRAQQFKEIERRLRKALEDANVPYEEVARRRST
jgi:hypothetical protein